MKKAFCFISFCLLLSSCSHMPWDRICYSPERTVVYFLNELHAGNIVDAKKYCTPKACLFIDSCIINNINVKPARVFDVYCRIKSNRAIAICEFCCVEDSNYTNFIIIRNEKTEGNCWEIDELGGVLDNRSKKAIRPLGGSEFDYK